MSAVLTTEAVFACFLSEQRARGFLHSHSYTGNPLGCAAALASLAIFESDQILARNRQTAAHISVHAESLRAHPNVRDVRQTGMIMAIELGQDKAHDFAPEQRRGLRAYRAGLQDGVLLRPLGDTLYWMPPYCITHAELDFLATATLAAIEESCS
jgi:adenosylmethionine-8-amino-7-oxononanoate aminotransferase